ncbi:hypothetical protein C4J94_2143 [Pseudomonas sp. R5-89-07]|nr:hypothetical protein C4J94_2143 [Pseudomonas sp. R5-89-07]
MKHAPPSGSKSQQIRAVDDGYLLATPYRLAFIKWSTPGINKRNGNVSLN